MRILGFDVITDVYKDKRNRILVFRLIPLKTDIKHTASPVPNDLPLINTSESN